MRCVKVRNQPIQFVTQKKPVTTLWRICTILKMWIAFLCPLNHVFPVFFFFFSETATFPQCCLLLIHFSVTDTGAESPKAEMALTEALLVMAEDMKGPGSGFQTDEKFAFEDIDIPRGSQNKGDGGRKPDRC